MADISWEDLEDLVTKFARVVHEDSGDHDCSFGNVQQVMSLSYSRVERKFENGSPLEQGCHDCNRSTKICMHGRYEAWSSYVRRSS